MFGPRIRWWTLVVLWIGTWVLGCKPDKGSDADSGADEREDRETAEVGVRSPHLGEGAILDDLGRVWIYPDAPRKEGVLRILATPTDDWLPRQGLPAGREWFLAKQFARSIGRVPQLVVVEDFNDLLGALNRGEGDMAVAFLTQTEERQKEVDFSIPLIYGREVILVRDDDPLLDDPDALDGRTITVREGTAFVETAKELQEEHPNLQIDVVPGSTSKEMLFSDLASGKVDLVMEDEFVGRAVEIYLDELSVGPTVGHVTPIGWAFRKGDDELLGAANLFITARRLAASTRFDPADARKPRNWAEIKEAGTIRVAMRNTAATYYQYRGALVGFEYEMALAFARKHDLVLEIEILPPQVGFGTYLDKGRADIIANWLSILPSRQEKYAFSTPYHRGREVVVGTEDDAGEGLEALDGRTITVRDNTAMWEQLEAIKEANGYGYELQNAPNQENMEQLIDRVASRDIDLTAADEHIYELEATWQEGLGVVATYGEERQYGWMMRKSNPELVAKVNEFMAEFVNSQAYDQLWAAHFVNPKLSGHYALQRISPDARKISDYDDLLRKWATEYGLDWRLVASQMFQESRFNPRARSWVGAQGLMQIMPRTGRDLGLRRPFDPDDNIEAGTRYLAELVERWHRKLPIEEATWFGLASYNAGLGHVLDAQVLAKQQGLDPDKWFDNVEVAIEMLADPKYHRKARYGYVRGEEPAHYVHIIRQQYNGYRRIFDGPESLPEPHVADEDQIDIPMVE